MIGRSHFGKGLWEWSGCRQFGFWKRLSEKQTSCTSLSNMSVLKKPIKIPLQVHFPKSICVWRRLVSLFFCLVIERLTRRYKLIITIWRILMIFIWIIMDAHLKWGLSKQLSSGTLPPACLSICTCFRRVLDKVSTTQRWIPASRSPLANYSIWLCGFPDWPVFPLKPEQTETRGFDGLISGHVARLHHLVHALTVTHAVCHRLSFQQ